MRRQRINTNSPGATFGVGVETVHTHLLDFGLLFPHRPIAGIDGVLISTILGLSLLPVGRIPTLISFMHTTHQS